MKTILLMLVLSAMAAGQTVDKYEYILGNPDVIEAARPGRLLCTVPLSKSPAVRGKFRLGMTKAEYGGPVLADVGAVGSRAAGGTLDPTFYSGKLIRLEVIYMDGVTWDSDAEFAYVIATEFGLPVAAWRSLDSRGLAMFCDGWLMIARENWIELRDEAAIRAMAKSEAAAKIAEVEAKKKTFKP